MEKEELELQEKQQMYRHSMSHILAKAVKQLYSDVKVAIGPAIDNGFYYDFDNVTITPEDFGKIEDKMREIINKNEDFTRLEVSKQEALELFKDEPYKVELIEAIPDGEMITTYTQGDYIEVCRGPHIKSTGLIKSFKLTKISGAYLKGDSKNKMLTRIYGVVFDKKSEMDEYFKLLEEAMKRDHRKLGKELELFFFDETAPGMPYWMPKGFTM